ncbi:hypothetical protein KP509_01G014700 [Ceratopteris richardii]|uniref:Pectinesterase n=1 Tax=Ceratopteris richardii TaxID=49495 RepID=A0A8T2VHJ5_CERRI|nr:hypothetical protein KP509_01G014700 [Ceratopteris richardii]
MQPGSGGLQIAAILHGNRRWTSLAVSFFTVLAVSIACIPHFQEHHVAIASDQLQLNEKLSIPGFGVGIRAILGSICSRTLFPDACLDELSSFSLSALVNPSQLVSFAVQAALSRTNEAYQVALEVSSRSGLSLLERQCTLDCAGFMEDAKEQLGSAFSKLSAVHGSDIGSIQGFLRDVKVWLSASLSLQTACVDGFDLAPGSVQVEVESHQGYLAKVIGNGLFLVDVLARVGNSLDGWVNGFAPIPPYVHLRRRLLDQDMQTDRSESHNELMEVEDGFPSWVSASERRLLQNSPNNITADAVVAQDGSGNFMRITDALMNIPSNRKGRYVIYIKKGIYKEVFNITKDQKYISFIGDGIGSTVITGDRNVASGDFNTYRTCTVGIAGKGFYARDITIQNTAGPSGHQAVALRAQADFLVFYRCSFEGYQDTLYALSSRQFYRDCVVSGTVDFIFGNAIALFQNCNITARLPLSSQKNTLTAQGRKLSADISGYSFQNCTIQGEPELLKSSVPTFLGRPWKAYSRVVFLESEMQALVNPGGWLEWNESNPFTDTVYYGEYANRGPGANTANRVKWPGVRANLSPDEASQYSVQNFLAGETWLGAYDVKYQSNLA